MIVKERVTYEQLLTHKSKLRVYTNEQYGYVDPYPFLKLKLKIGVFAEEIFDSHQGIVRRDLDTKALILEDKYFGTTSDPHNLKTVLGLMAEA